MVDLVQFLSGAPATRVYAQPLPAPPHAGADDVLVTLTLADGSLATISYVSGGDRSVPKERVEVFGGGRSAILDDFLSLSLHASGSARRDPWRTQDKGHAAELEAFLRAVASGGESPIAPEDAAHTTRITLAAVESARSGLPVDLGEA
jgi:predicted dehydrogenase